MHKEGYLVGLLLSGMDSKNVRSLLQVLFAWVIHE